MDMMKPGMKLKSAACDTEVMVIKCGQGSVECGGAPMAADRPASPLPLDPTFAGGTLMGKRYVDDSGFELLCVKPGKGSLSVNGTTLTVKDAKPLPASD
jgi:hypothetical protein